MRVLQVVGQLQIGGQEMMSKNFFMYIDKEKFQFDYLLYTEKIGEYEEQLTSEGARIFRIPPRASYRNPNKFVKSLEEFIRINGPYDVIHCHTFTNAGYVMEAAKKMGVMVRISHSHSTNSGKHGIVYSMYMWEMRRRILKFSTCLIACGEAAGESLFGKNKFANEGIIINNGIDVSKFEYNQKIRKEVRRELDIEEDFVVGHIGRLAEVKNHKFLLGVFKQVLDRIENSKLLLVGNGPLMNELIDLARSLGIEDKVIFLGNRFDAERLLQAMDVFAYPSVYEGLPVALVEAQAASLPIVASSNITISAKMNEEFYFLDITREDEWAVKIEELSNFKRRNINPRVIENGYDIRNEVRKLESIYVDGVEVKHEQRK